MASFQGKIGWKRLTKRGNKNYRSVSFLPKSVIENSKKIAKKFKKLKKIPLWLLLKPKQGGKGRRREKIKIIVPFRSKSMRDRKFQKNSKKVKKIKKYHYGVISSQNRLEKAHRENKNFRFVSFRSDPTRKRKFIKNSKKIQ